MNPLEIELTSPYLPAIQEARRILAGQATSTCRLETIELLLRWAEAPGKEIRFVRIEPGGKRVEISAAEMRIALEQDIEMRPVAGMYEYGLFAAPPREENP